MRNAIQHKWWSLITKAPAETITWSDNYAEVVKRPGHRKTRQKEEKRQFESFG